MKRGLFLLLFLSSFLLSVNHFTKEHLQVLQDNKIQRVEIFFSDINGSLKQIVIPAHRLPDALKNGLAIDGSSIKGLNRIQESDSVICIDLDSLQINPFESGVSTVSFFGSIYQCDGSIHPNDPRALLETIQKDALQKGYKLLAGAELEFFLFTQDPESEYLQTVDDKGYCSATTSSSIKCFEEELFLAIAGPDATLNCEKIHHEVAPGQYEVVLGYSDALNLADRILYAQHLIKTIASKYNMLATFIPKPIAGINGSGMHIHASVQTTDGENVFFDRHAEHFLSRSARTFITGILQHAREMNILFNSCANSFKRLIPGYEAPFYLCAGSKNRSAAIRIPEVSRLNIEKHNGSAVRIELRWPDGSCNPYLALAGLFTAGLQGMSDDNTPLCTFVNSNLYHADTKTLSTYHIELLPSDLEESIELAQESIFLKNLLGQELHALLTKEKRNSWETYLQNVSKHDPLVISAYELESAL